MLRENHGEDDPTSGRLTARPTPSGEGRVRPGLQPLGAGGRRDGLLYVPAGYSPARPAPLVVTLHGAGGQAEKGIAPLMHYADDEGIILVAPEARQQTWDVIYGGFGPDVAFIDRALQQVFDRFAVDPAFVGVEGFSDGASYALSIGLTNGDLFRRVIAFSPGFMVLGEERGAPKIFISHGTHDTTLPIDRTSRRLVPRLRTAGYAVAYREFDGKHTPRPFAAEAVDWFMRASH